MAKIFFKNEGGIKTFPGKQKLKEFITKYIAWEMLKRVFKV